MLLEVNGQATDLFLETENFFIGELALISMKNSMALDLHSLNSGFTVNVDSSVVTDQPNKLNAKITSEFTSGKTLRECLKDSCLVYDGFLNYTVTSADTNLFGLITCSDPPCNISTVSHSVETNDTNGFFKNIIETRLFNPILIFYIQSNILSGELFGSGHKKILQ